MFFRRLKASQSTLNLCSEAELSIVCYTYGIDVRLRRNFASRFRQHKLHLKQFVFRQTVISFRCASSSQKSATHIFGSPVI